MAAFTAAELFQIFAEGEFPINLDRYHTTATNRPATRANENGPVIGGCPISSMVTVNIYGQHLYRELNSRLN